MNPISDICVNDFNLLCRICLQSELDMKYLFQGEAANMLNCGEFMEVNENDGLPAHICGICEQELIQSYAFKEKCSIAQNKLKIKLEQEDVSPITESKAIKDEITVEDESAYKCLINTTTKVNYLEELEHSNITITCSTCKSYFPSKNEFQQHKCLPKDVSNTPEELALDADPLVPFSYKCEETDLQLHESSHPPGTKTDIINKSHICHECGRGFAKVNYLTKHSRAHTLREFGEKKHFCNECGQGYTSRYKFNLHMRKHSGEPLQVCPNCNKRFTNPTSLAIHVLSHTGEKPYKCHVCTKSFNQSCNLTRHIRTHTGEKRFKCHVCMKSFSQKVDLNKHITTHTREKPFICSQCGKSFNLSSSLTRHFRIHTGEKPYACDKCTKRFTNSRNLKYHLVTHKSEEPYVCSTAV